MSNWNSYRNFSSIKSYTPSFSPFENPNMSFKISSRNRRVIGINLLPVIKEETVCSESEIELRNVFFSNSKLRENYKNRKTLNIIQNKNFDHKTENVKKVEKASKEQPKSFFKLPPLANINCMMNINVKQSQPIWETSFGKNLMYGKENSKDLELRESTRFSSVVLNAKKISYECSDHQHFSHRPILNKGSRKQEKKDEVQISGSFSSKNKRKKSRKMTKENHSTQKDIQIENQSENSSKTILEPQKSNGTLTENFITFNEISTESFSRNQHFLTECVRSILEDTKTIFACEYCEETFTNTEEFYRHNEKHEEEKQVCLLCDETFYNGKKFVQHLLTHEGVDRFSCKICRKYFPSLRKYKQHYKKSHEPPLETTIMYHDDQPNDFFFKKRLRVFKCKRCKEKFSSEDALKAHKRNHIRMDLMGAYLLNTTTNV